MPLFVSGSSRCRVALAASLLAFAPACGTPSAVESADTAAPIARVNAQLAGYHDTESAKSDRKLRFVYFAPSDSPPAAHYRERLTRVMEETARFFAREFQRVGLTHVQPLPLDRDADGLLRFTVVHGREPWKSYNSKESAAARKVREECLPALRAAGIDPDRETILLFHTIMEWDEVTRRFREDAPYRGGGNARSGFCWQIDAPPLDPLHLAAREPHVDDGQVGRISLGHWNSRYIGGVIHELGHALGLDHNQENPREAKTLGHSLMGNGNQTYGCELHGHGLGTFLSTADTLRLASHPLFTGSTKGLDTKNAHPGELCDLHLATTAAGLVVTGRVESAPASYAVVAYLDGEGRGDYDALTATAVPDTEGRFRLECRDLPRGKTTALRLAAFKLNGLAIDHDSLPAFPVSSDGIPDLSETRPFLALDPIVRALRVGNIRRARELTAALPHDEPGKAFAAPLLTPPADRPASPDTTAKSISLCDLRPSHAKVGWREPAFDYSPEDLLVSVGGKLQRRFIYAHAPATYTWKLDGSWQRFQATCALGNGYSGSVEFVVKADGLERWRSGVVRGKTQKICDLELAGATTLELIVENGGDDFHRDHGFWLNPTLRR